MRKKLALFIILATSASFIGSVYLHAEQHAEMAIQYGFSVAGKLIKWITTTQADFECSGEANRQYIDTQSSPGDVILEKKEAWQSWWNSSWRYRLRIEIKENSGSNLTDYQVLINLTPKTFNYSKAKPDGSDLRFTQYNLSSGNEEELPYWIEVWNTSGISKIWVKVKKLDANTKATIYMYYGNNAAEGKSNGTATFEFFDDFENGLTWYEDGLWHTTSKKWNSYNHSKWYGMEATNNYDTGSQNSGNLISPEFNGVESAKLELWFWREVENVGWSGYDQTIIYDSQDNITWNQIWYNDSSDASGAIWKFLSIQMTPYARYIRFYFDTVDEFFNNYWGWFIDDLRIRKYVNPEPTINLGEEETQYSWLDYFGGDAAIEKKAYVKINDGDVYIENEKILDFLGITNPSVSHVAKYDVDDDVIEPATSFNSTGVEFSTTHYTRIYYSDNLRASHNAPLGYKAQHIFRFKVDATESCIAKINVSWEGRCRYRQGNRWRPFTMSDGIRIWNFSSSSWESIGDIAASERMIAVEFYNIGDYLENGYLYLMAYAEYDNRRVRIQTDYVAITLSFKYGNITSVPISPANLARWEKFYANATLPSGTNITYKILNATNNETICIITSNEAANGYNISFIKADEIKLYAEMYTNSSSIPFLHDWGISWMEGYYENGYLISCPHDTGNATDYANISWNATLPSGTQIKFQISTSPNGISWTEFLGPDGSNSSYYNISDTDIWNGHDGDRYIRYKVYLETSDASKTPVLHDVTIAYYGG